MRLASYLIIYMFLLRCYHIRRLFLLRLHHDSIGVLRSPYSCMCSAFYPSGGASRIVACLLFVKYIGKTRQAYSLIQPLWYPVLPKHVKALNSQPDCSYVHESSQISGVDDGFDRLKQYRSYQWRIRSWVELVSQLWMLKHEMIRWSSFFWCRKKSEIDCHCYMYLLSNTYSQYGDDM